MLPLNPYNQVWVQIKASTFWSKRQEWYRVKILPPVLKVDSKATTLIGMLKRSLAINKSSGNWFFI